MMGPITRSICFSSGDLVGHINRGSSAQASVDTRMSGVNGCSSVSFV